MIKFDGIEKDYIKVLHTESRPGAPTVNRTTVGISNRHGARVGRLNYDKRILAVPVTIEFEGLRDLQSKKEETARWLIQKDAKELEFADEAGTIYFAHYTSGLEQFDESPSAAKATIIFTCYDPFKYGREIVAGLNFTNTRGGESSPCLVTVRFRGNAEGYTVKHTQADKEARVVWDFVNGDILELDMNRRRVTINGHVRMTAFDFRSQMFEVLPGQNTLETNVNSAWTEITYRPRWL